MALHLDKPLSWKKALAASHPDAAAELAMLSDLQGNILKGHGRPFTCNVFVAFDYLKRDLVRAFLADLSRDVTSALDQLTAVQVYHQSGVKADDFVAFMLSAAGYKALDEAEHMPQSTEFGAGMKARSAHLGDQPERWEEPFKQTVHAMILLAANTEASRDALKAHYLQRIAATNGAVKLLAPTQDGRARFNNDDNGIEHFGYVDGRSQPLALVEDIEAERDKFGGINVWDPTIPLSQLLVKCPGGKLEVSFGSYFVFRKLEQDVRGFKEAEETLPDKTGTPGGLGELGGALVVGRFENGTPVRNSAQEIPVPPNLKGSPAGVPNNFDYAKRAGEQDDPQFKCPFAGHIRKSNPRSDTPDSKDHLMARRGIPFGDRNDDPNDGEIDNKPSPHDGHGSGVGLLFMAYQSDLAKQFEFTQHDWVNNGNFRQPNTGPDPLIGQPTGKCLFPNDYGVSLGQAFAFGGFVNMVGGEYLFAPSITYLRSFKHPA